MAGETVVVFPAHAGMSPLEMPLARAVTRFPRPRGDEPETEL